MGMAYTGTDEDGGIGYTTNPNQSAADRLKSWIRQKLGLDE